MKPLVAPPAFARLRPLVSRFVALLGMAASCTLAHGEDIDVYAAPRALADRPNILVVIDNSANWSSAAQRWPGGIKQGEAQLDALREVIGELDESVNVGLMLFTPGTGQNPSGAYVRFHLRPMTPASRNALAELIGLPTNCRDGPNSLNGTPDCIRKNFDSPAEKVGTADADYSAALFDAFKYFGGHTSPAHAADGIAGSPQDPRRFGPQRYAGNPDPKSDPAAYDPTGSRYVSPLSGSASCAHNYLILIGNGFPAQDSPADLLAGVEGDTAQLPLPGFTVGTTGQTTPTGVWAPPPAGRIRFADEWARFLYATDVSPLPGQQNVRTYTIDVFRDRQDLDQTALLMSMARAGGGRYFSAEDGPTIAGALRRVFSEIQSTPSVFASSSLPVSVNAKSTYLNQVFIGMFRPDAERRPRWAGNLKQYQMKLAGDALDLVDRNGDPAVSATTGFVAACADSWWSSDSGLYWNFPGSSAAGSCPAETSRFPSPGASSLYSDAPDGPEVEKGGAAQRLRGTGSLGGTLVSANPRHRACGPGETPLTAPCRALKTLDANGALVDVTPTSSGLDPLLVDWTRGKDVDNENGNADAAGVPLTAEMRPSVHGAVIHSQPAVVDYGSERGGVVVFYGADDGVLHAVDGGKTDAGGNELWGFVAPEFFPRMARLRDNGQTTPLLRVGTAGVGDPKDYFFDGPLAVHQKEQRVWLFATMRRGGRAIYAFDASNPALPTFKWRRGCFAASTTNDAACTSGWTAIGQTWSKPQVVDIEGYPRPVLVFGGGYDTCEDADSATRCATGARKGAGVWFVDADDGRILRIYATHASVPGEIAVLKNAAGRLAYAYAADTGGNLYRINVGSIDGTTFSPAWTSDTSPNGTQIAALAETTSPRKFLNGPEVFTFLGRNFVAIGSGNRENPLYSATRPASAGNGARAVSETGCGVSDQFYVVKDDTAQPQNGERMSDVRTADLVDISNGTTRPLDDPTVKGWRLPLGYCEKVVNKALAIGGKLFFGTNQALDAATATPCTNNLGRARIRSIDITMGASTSSEVPGGGMPPSPTGGVVQIEGGGKVPFCIGCGAPPPAPPTASSTAAARGSATVTIECTSCSSLASGRVHVGPPPMRSRVFWYLQGD
jgi:type IV pilus assembly protein PilY1